MYQHDYIDNFDLALLGPETGLTSSLLLQHGEGYNQKYPRQPQHQLTLAERMQGDKLDTLYSMTSGDSFDIEYESLAASSNLHEMMELGELEEVKMEADDDIEDENDHQALIDEVEKFLHQHEAIGAIVSDQVTFINRTLFCLRPKVRVFD